MPRLSCSLNLSLLSKCHERAVEREIPPFQVNFVLPEVSVCMNSSDISGRDETERVAKQKA